MPGAAGFHVVLQGSCWLSRAGGEPLHVAAGDVVFRPHGQGHTLASDPSVRPLSPPCHPATRRYAVDTVGLPTPAEGAATVTLCGAYEMDPVLVHPLVGDLPELIHRPAGSPQLRATVDLLAAELAHPRLGTAALIPALLDTLLLYLLRSWLDDQPTRQTTGWAAALKDPAVAAALQAIHRSPATPWTVATLAAEGQLSRAPFARRFTGLVGRPPLAYLTWWRLSTASRLLKATDTPLHAVAAAVGYTSEFAFANAFKRQYQISPGRYRRLRP